MLTNVMIVNQAGDAGTSAARGPSAGAQERERRRELQAMESDDDDEDEEEEEEEQHESDGDVDVDDEEETHGGDQGDEEEDRDSMDGLIADQVSFSFHFTKLTSLTHHRTIERETNKKSERERERSGANCRVA